MTSEQTRTVERVLREAVHHDKPAPDAPFLIAEEKWLKLSPDPKPEDKA